MKSYPSISGPNKAPQGPCIAFYKYDGSNIRVEWSYKKGWYKFGSRNVLLDESTPILGQAIRVFLETYGDALAKVFVDNKNYRDHIRANGATVFCEFFGPTSFAGVHSEDDPKQVVLFDVNINKRGFVLPRDFIRDFGHLRIPEVVYEGNFNNQFVNAIRVGEFPVVEGIVAKGVNAKNNKNPQHGLWMAKVKTAHWISELKNRLSHLPEFRKVYEDNLKEQGLV